LRLFPDADAAQSFKKLIETVEEIGHTKNAILELESKVVAHTCALPGTVFCG
jgi:hypothetical protein